MIVQINQNNSDKYRKLFTEAYEFLESLNDSPVTPGKNQFSSLAEYYGHIADLFNQAKYEYIMVPLDEEPFNIDLNTRTITVPSSFNKCTSVQNDVLAETIIFVTDRYFDFMDLANVNIYVQWTTPDGFNGATRVEMRDLESEPGKIKFAWPLNNLITKVPGTVKFAVRFFALDNNNEQTLAYSLNTLASEIIIKPALQPDGPSQVEKNIIDLFQKAIINSNYAATGVNPPVQPAFIAPGTDIAIGEKTIIDGKEVYIINAIVAETDNINYMKINNMTEEKFLLGSYWIKVNGQYIKANAFNENEVYFIQIQKGVKYVGLNNDNTITLYAQAIVPDSGQIIYKWYYQAQDGDFNDKAYDCEEINFGEVDHNVFINVGKNPLNGEHERYYIIAQDGNYIDANNIAYKDYVGNIPADEDLYERYSTLTIPADSEDEPVSVTGLYYAAAWNIIDASGYTKVDNLTEDRFNTGDFYIKIGKQYIKETTFDPNEDYYVKIDKILETPFPTETSTCVLPGPHPITVSKNLNEQLIFDENEEIQLTIEIEDDDYDPEISYDWRTSITSKESVFTEADTVLNDNSNNLRIPGYVLAPIMDEETFNQGIYYIIDKDKKYIRAKEYDNNVSYYTENAGWFGVNIISKLNRKSESYPSNIVKVTHNPIPPEVNYLGDDPQKIFGSLTATKESVTFEVNVNNQVLDINNLLKSENIEYIWQMSPVDSVWQTLSGKEKGVNIEDNKITITSDFTTPYATFRCLVINHLNGKKAVFDHSGELEKNEGEKFGIYNKIAPHIYSDNKSFEFVLNNSK